MSQNHKPRKPSGSAYSATMPQMRPLFGHQEAVQGAQRAAEKYAELRLTISRAQKKDFPEQPTLNFVELAEAYWQARLWHERDRPRPFGEDLERFRAATAVYAAAVENAPTSVILAVESRVGKEIEEAAGARRPLQLAALLLSIQAAAERVVSPEISSGAPPKQYADEPVAMLDAMWTEVVGKLVPKASIEGPASFASHGAQFIFEIMKAIDQRITAEEVNTAINKLPRPLKA